jgi:CheY-like chemotaxis protein
LLERDLLRRTRKEIGVKNENPALRDARAQAAVLRTLATEMERQGPESAAAESLREQAIEESARLVSAYAKLAESRSEPGGAAGAVGAPEGPGTMGRRWPRVLVVEDDDDTRTAIARGLAPEYEVVVAVNGVEGLRAASESSFDAIVADLAMPEMDGITMVEEIRRRRAPAAIPVIFLTAESAPERVVAGFSAGGTSYLVKPVDLELLDQELRMALASPRD